MNRRSLFRFLAGAAAAPVAMVLPALPVPDLLYPRYFIDPPVETLGEWLAAMEKAQRDINAVTGIPAGLLR